VNKLGSQLQVLRVPTLDKTKMKSNHYWVMVLVSKLANLRVLKLHDRQCNFHVGQDFFKFLLKGLNYMTSQGRQLQKVQISNLKGFSTGEFMYPCLKSHSDLVSLCFLNSNITLEDAKAIGKVLADFRQVRELDLTNSSLDPAKTKEIADGLMRAKQLEILKLGKNPRMGDAVSTVVYNLAFSPKIRHIDLSELSYSTADAAEAIYKLVKISGAIETLILKNSGIVTHLKEDFFKALGENKTLKYLNLELSAPAVGSSQATLMGKAVAMNAYRNGALESLNLKNWFNSYSLFNNYISGLMISVKDHEVWYGDKKLASEMEKEDLVAKLFCKLKYLNIDGCTLTGFPYNYKEIQK